MRKPVQLSNVVRRESPRLHFYVSCAAARLNCGGGPTGYEFAIEAMAEIPSQTVETA